MPFRLNRSREHFKFTALLVALPSICTFLIKLLFLPLGIETYATLFPLIIAIACYLYALSDTYIGFDETFFYVKNKKIPLSFVQAIRLTETANNKNVPYWKIVYTSSSAHQSNRSVRVLPNIYNDRFERFIKAVEQANPQAETDHYHFTILPGGMPKTTWGSRNIYR
ncbi:hypothetical protein [Siphonobacter curvatus]|uniref:Uncharacterized protein n=1 Tax=Siphonobacter curvatus TaxID=2094562 RepID=A0A2S7IEQ9_9BACT|nr:hypothetical protein [Siphonobacter curvatus]PQA52997.1 hypothetical protein C5O19_25240 [Siphonobacter curvatus]